jgi:hypothetical protein
VKVALLTADDLIWKADGASNDGASYRFGAGTYQREFHVDPYPAYTHDVALVEDLVGQCCEAFPLNGALAALFVCSREFASRFNGLTWEDTIWRRADGSDWDVDITKPDGTIVKTKGQAHSIGLSGKRTPRMKAQTRYIVTHEYGHAAFNHTRRLLGINESDEDKLETEYMRVREGDNPTTLRRKGRGPARWHQLASEVIANDFRIAVMQTETDFWPHDAPPPTPTIVEWWQRAVALTKAVMP